MAIKTIKHALLTGFEPFGTPRPSENRSWEVVKQLAGKQIYTGDSLVVCHCYEIPVSYNPVSELIPQLHRSQEFSIVIHCGAGVPGMVRLEKLAHRSGYIKPGNGGESDVPAGGCVPGYDTADVLESTIAVDRLKDALVEKGWSNLAVSLDAGRYLCDFTYYTSLAEGATTYKRQKRQAPATLFVHVPPSCNDPYSDEELAKIVCAILRCVA
ncbi:pyroglutamyl-peptidase activity protein [Coemansia sp. RSA 1813]|nr:Pyroglutamyl-peptidase 1 [Coemansia sp. RSA 1646]KAJ1769676.1 pyroglutamyl-peptidase activity protein [Coemansia sp. RSA 1843]KAJ2091195.1 pyroglutamyl-peptidase activity protein [Coemansia sp. RSA 986]KAJ2211641.1 pyroglutamyl-peptidase activity protein [Coemansia sp. RSA 487]KAJ2571080.1 pyroglutamyl-peptidase activity protein [Coemansia sp. RSA 1813]